MPVPDARSLTPLLSAAALLGGAWLVVADGPAQSRGQKVDARLAAVEKGLRNLEGAQRELDLRLVHAEAANTGTDRHLQALVPQGAQWLDLSPGSNVAWDLGAGGSARVQFVRLDAGLPVFLIDHRALRGELRLGPGESVVAVDDLGTTRRTYTVGFHALRRDRAGVPASAWVSVVLTEK
jgi:hypothetical protein